MSRSVSVHRPLLQKTKLNPGAPWVLAEVWLSVTISDKGCELGFTMRTGLGWEPS